jgi:hypothetical protein
MSEKLTTSDLAGPASRSQFRKEPEQEYPRPLVGPESPIHVQFLTLNSGQSARQLAAFLQRTTDLVGIAGAVFANDRRALSKSVAAAILSAYGVTPEIEPDRDIRTDRTESQSDDDDNLTGAVL